MTAPVTLPAPVTPVEALVTPVEALVVREDGPPAVAELAAPAPAVAPGVESQVEVLRLLEVVTSMCDHVIEYIEADRAERRVMLETLSQLGRVITDGIAVTVAAAAVPPVTAPATAVANTAPAEITAEETAKAPVEPFAFAMRERVVGGSMPAGPDPATDARPRPRAEPRAEPVIDLVGPESESELEAESAPRAEPEVASAPSPMTEIAVEVRGKFGDRWVDGFEICEVMTTPAGPRYRLRRRRDGVVLPELFDATNIRHVETFEELSGSALGSGAPHANGHGRTDTGNRAGSTTRWGTGRVLEHPQRAGRRDRLEAVGDGALPHVKGRLPTLGRILEDVVDGERSTRDDVPRPALVVGGRDVFGVAAVDEQESERRRPGARDRDRSADDAHHHVFEIGREDRAPEERQRVHTPGLRVDHLGIVVLPSRLVLLGTSVMIDGEQHRARVAGRGAEIDRGLPAVGTDLEQRPEPTGRPGGVVQRETFVVRHEALGRTCDLEQAIVHHGRAH